MVYTNINHILFLTVLLLSISFSVYGANFNVTTTVDKNDGACSAADCSFREAVVAANTTAGSDTITMPAGNYILTIPGEDDRGNLGDLDIQDSVSITGAGPNSTVINANGIDRVFHVDPEKDGNLSVNFSQMTISGGLANFGAGILNLANLTLNNVTVANNAATSLGGGIYNRNTMSIINSAIANNQANSGSGGGIFNDPLISLSVENSSFVDNSSSSIGGAVYNAGTLRITGVTAFTDNSAGSLGGAIGMVDNSNNTLNSVNFSENVANDGGAISVGNNAMLVMDQNTFTGNNASGLDLGGGGAIFNFGGFVNISTSVFSSNTSTGEGGGAIVMGRGTLDIANSAFNQNQAIKDPAFSLPPNLTTPAQGGALYMVGSQRVSITDTTFNGNSAGTNGGAIFNYIDIPLDIIGGAISNNTADELGGGLLNVGNTTLSGLLISGNTASIVGGGIANQRGSLTLLSSEVRSNKAKSGAGIDSAATAILIVRQSTFAENETTVLDANRPQEGFGGGIDLRDNTNTTVENSTFSANSSNRGGAIAQRSNTALNIINTTIANNSSIISSSGLFNYPGLQINIRNSIVSGDCEIQGILNSQGGNLESPGNTCNFNNPSDANQIANLMLLPLADYGGPTQTHNLNPNSIAVDFVSPPSCLSSTGGSLTVDQRDFVRPFDGDGDTVSDCDSGAVEYQIGNTLFLDNFEN